VWNLTADVALSAAFSPAFTLLHASVTPAEMMAFVLSLWMVACNMRVNPLGWPLGIVASLLYCGLFWRSKLYGDASLQIFFAVLGGWGWWQWLHGTIPGDSALPIRRLAPSQRGLALGAVLLAWPMLGWFLQHHTDTDVPYWDALPTAASVLGQFLLGRKFIENWPVWVSVNVVSVGLYAYKGLWLTVVLYAIFVALSVAGWRAWTKLQPPAP
jgi:nicotinamide mononucleotide transporter